MNEPLTKSQAYRVFGQLYNKPRSPELQKQVEEIVNKYSDIFVRIQKIQELDKSQQQKTTIIKPEQELPNK